MIMDVIEKARKGAAEDSARYYVEGLENTIVMSLFDGKESPKGKQEITEDGNLPNFEVSVKGEKPKSGNMCIDSSGKVTQYSLNFGTYNITSTDGNQVEFTEEIQDMDCEGTGSTNANLYANGTIIYFNPALGQVCTKEEAEANVGEDGMIINKDGCMKWYAFGDTEEAETLNVLIGNDTGKQFNYSGSSGGASDSAEVYFYVKANLMDAYTENWTSNLNPRFMTVSELKSMPYDIEYNVEHAWLQNDKWFMHATAYEDNTMYVFESCKEICNVYLQQFIPSGSYVILVNPVITIDKSLLK